MFSKGNCCKTLMASILAIFFIGCQHPNPPPVSPTHKSTTDISHNECNEICKPLKGKKYKLCLDMCTSSLNPATMRLNHSTSQPGLTTCSDFNKSNVKSIGNSKQTCGGIYIGPGYKEYNLKDWPICNKRFFNPLFTDPEYWNVVTDGLPAVPCLIEETRNHEITNVGIPLFGGNFRKGDIAFVAIFNIVRIRGEEEYSFFSGDVKKDGFGVLYEFTSDKNNREILYSRLTKWWQSENQNLFWIKAPCHLAGGFWTTKEGFLEMVDITYQSIY